LKSSELDGKLKTDQHKLSHYNLSTTTGLTSTKNKYNNELQQMNTAI